MIGSTPDAPAILPVDAAALSFAKKWNLVCENGQVVCLRGCGQLATLPSLCCRECLAARRRGLR
jgi:hypothetical protein